MNRNCNACIYPNNLPDRVQYEGQENYTFKDNRSKLFEYIVGIFRNNKCHLYRINIVEDHVHIVSHLHSTVALGSLVKDIKIARSAFIKDKAAGRKAKALLPVPLRTKANSLSYVKNQEEHHKKITFREGYIALLDEHGIEFMKSIYCSGCLLNPVGVRSRPFFCLRISCGVIQIKSLRDFNGKFEHEMM
ncbi:MAG TPA: transposase [Ignavibacteriaceae bacterium]